jgi:hypothetical protein
MTHDMLGRKLNPRYRNVGITAFADLHRYSARHVRRVIAGKSTNPTLLAAWERYVAEELDFVLAMKKYHRIERPDRTRAARRRAELAKRVAARKASNNHLVRRIQTMTH